MANRSCLEPEISQNCSSSIEDEQSILPCKKEELQCGNGLCLSNWLRCHYKKDCGRDYMSIKLTCSTSYRPKQQRYLVKEDKAVTELDKTENLTGFHTQQHLQ
ncbi:hypothetical protein Anapl_00412 [Anas platyrhynchos]|uniref:Uncharacterized protein n=1 Tax=Anas platyrhynchos TaxID=8839 RepID=R0LKU7_ANAPL|nr:hypothetical protein Anapl_00412 [Anas platyrhynchos]